MEVEKSLLDRVIDRVGEFVIIDGRHYRIIADDSHSQTLRKKWDYILEDVKTKETRRVLSSELRTQ